MPSATPVGQAGATGPCTCRDKIVNVATPATEVTNVEASAAGATSAAGRPDPIGPVRPGGSPGQLATKIMPCGSRLAPRIFTGVIWPVYMFSWPR